ncbi:MAG: DNA-3-methyladenine glycosylase 2 family protein [Lachnospiraceae bacterium]|nr:DNA-3-methyladenine glycosylase 2 family protein [Lachnospiraceae bacterium]
MYILDIKEYDNTLNLGQIEESGQCFRFRHIDTEGCQTFCTISKGRYLEISDLRGGRFCLSCDEGEFRDFWYDYFDLGTDYGTFKNAIDAEDTFMVNAARYGAGIRILRQDLWEMMISFIISQRKSIPAIRTSIESLCKAYGEPIKEAKEKVYAFPTPEALARLDIEDLKPHGVGYRDKYILRLARDVCEGRIDIDSYRNMPEKEAVKALTEIYGVGVKVANCVSLFGLHNIDAFPEDVWIKRVIEEVYGGHFPKERYEGFAGVIQQYMFFYGKSKEFRQIC